MPTLIEAAQQVKNGVIGKPYFAKAWYANNRKPIGYGKKIPVPATWISTSGKDPLPKGLPGQPGALQLALVLAWGTGEACNNGTHEIDCCRWFLGADYPQKVTSSGGRYAYKDDWETPDTQVACFEFPDGKAITWESRSCNNYGVEGAGRGFIIYGEKGSLVNLGGGDYKIFDEKNKLVKEVKSEVVADPTNPVSASGNLDLYHFDNFIKAVRAKPR